MSIVIDDPDLERRLRALAAERGESVEDVLIELTRTTVTCTGTPPNAETRLEREARLAEARRIVDRINAEIIQDPRSPDDIIGYDEDGLPR